MIRMRKRFEERKARGYDKKERNSSVGGGCLLARLLSEE